MCIKISKCSIIIILVLLSILSENVICDKNNELEFLYHNYSSMTSFLKSFANKHRDLIQLYSIGQSVQKRELWVVRVSAVNERTALTPNIKLLANIHGNEAAGREILLHFIPYLVENYKQGEEKISHILKNNAVHILSSLNPDGFEKSREGSCTGSGRENSRDVDLNRSFPDFFRNNPIHKQPETEAVMKWMSETKFILSASLHGGAMVVNYPFESTKEDLFIEVLENKSPDDDVFQYLALTYSKTHSTMHIGKPCPGQRSFKNGITNGAAWYPLTGGMQDYNYAFHGCMELTLEVSCCKYPLAKELKEIWEQNKMALTEYCLKAGTGVKGIIYDSESMKPIGNASLMVSGRNMTFHTSSNGEFYRILLPGNYKLKVKSPNYITRITSFAVKDQGDIKYMTKLIILLNPGNGTDDDIFSTSQSTTSQDSIMEEVDTVTTQNVTIAIRSNFNNEELPVKFPRIANKLNSTQLKKTYSVTLLVKQYSTGCGKHSSFILVFILFLLHVIAQISTI